MTAMDRPDRKLYPSVLAGVAIAALAGGWAISADPVVGVTMAAPPAVLALIVLKRRGSEEVNPPLDERQRVLERSVLAVGAVAMFLVGFAGMVWELARGLPVTDLRATGVFLAGCLAAIGASLVLQRRL